MNQFTSNRTEPEQTPTPTPIPTLNADTEVKADTGILQTDNNKDLNKDLCLQLIHAETEEEVKSILRQHNYWGDSDEYWKKRTIGAILPMMKIFRQRLVINRPVPSML